MDYDIMFDIIFKSLWVEKVCYHCDIKRIENKKYFLLKYFQNIY
jgi:hypothetical protein